MWGGLAFAIKRIRQSNACTLRIIWCSCLENVSAAVSVTVVPDLTRVGWQNGRTRCFVVILQWKWLALGWGVITETPALKRDVCRGNVVRAIADGRSSRLGVITVEGSAGRSFAVILEFFDRADLCPCIGLPY